MAEIVEEILSAGGSRLHGLRQVVRQALLSTPSYQKLDPENRRQLANAFVRVCQAAAALVEEEVAGDDQARQAQPAAQALELDAPSFLTPRPRPTRPLARSQSAGSEFSGVAAQRVAGVTQAVLNAVSFPRFVTELINGVFKAMNDSNIQQLNSFVELLNNVATSTEGFADANIGLDRARQWLAEHYPASFEVSGDPVEPGDDPEDGGGLILRLKSGASAPSPEAVKVDLGLGPDETVPTGDPERTLVPLARRLLARNRQSMLASMVMLGLQRIVIESGRISAAMHFHIDTRSAAQADQGSTLDTRTSLAASGSFGYGPWGASASLSSTVGYVSTQRSQTTEEMNTDLDLSSAVEIYFKTDYLPLNRMAGPSQLDRIRANTRNPEAEMAIEAEKTREARARASEQSDAARRTELNARISGGSPPGSVGAGGNPGGRGLPGQSASSGGNQPPGSSSSGASANWPTPNPPATSGGSNTDGSGAGTGGTRPASNPPAGSGGAGGNAGGQSAPAGGNQPAGNSSSVASGQQPASNPPVTSGSSNAGGGAAR